MNILNTQIVVLKYDPTERNKRLQVWKRNIQKSGTFCFIIKETIKNYSQCQKVLGANLKRLPLVIDGHIEHQ